MDHVEAVTSSERDEMRNTTAATPDVAATLTLVAETIMEEALEPATTSPRSGAVYARPKHILDLFELYEYGRSKMRRRDLQRWRETFALGVSSDGIYCGRLDGKTGLLGVFWRTHNPVVDINLSIPEPSLNGTFVYVCWLWNAFGDAGVQALRDHLERTQIGARFVAHHDQRARARKPGALITTPLGNSVDDAAVDRILAERNGHGR